MRSGARLHPSHRSLQVRSWHGNAGVALLVPMFGGTGPSADLIARCLREQADAGCRLAVTGALNESEQANFLAAGFTLLERLHLLAHDLHDLPPVPPSFHSRRARRSDREAVLGVDGPAFEPFWRLDLAGLDEAVTATPVSRFRLVEADDGSGRPIAYAISGRSGPRGYLQRLAVHPDYQGNGLGTGLIIDGLRWMRRRGAERALVNTQERNASALALYEQLGFRREPEGLAVLSCPLSEPPYAAESAG